MFRHRGAQVENLAYGLASLVFLGAAVFVGLRGDGSTLELGVAAAGTLFFGAGAISFFARLTGAGSCD